MPPLYTPNQVPSQYPVITLVNADGSAYDPSAAIPPGTYAGTETPGVAATALDKSATDQTKDGGLTVRGQLISRPATTLTQIDQKPLDSGVDAPIEWVHNDTQSYLFHLICGPTMGNSLATGAALIGMGIDNSGTGLFVNNKATGIGIKITQNSTISSATAWGLLVNGGQGAAPAVWMQQNNIGGSANAQPVCVFFAYQSFNAAQRLVEWRKPGSPLDSTGLLAGYVLATGGLVWQSGVTFSADADALVPLAVQVPSTSTASLATFTKLAGGGTVTLTNVGGITASGPLQAVSAFATGAGAFLAFLDSNGTVDQRRWQFSQNSGSLLIGLKTDAGSSVRNPLTISGSTGNVTMLAAANLLLGTASAGGGTGVVALADRTVAPASTPTGGGVLYSEAGALKWKGSSGTVTVLAAA